MDMIECVKCSACGKLIDTASDDFIVFHGSVTVGMSGGIIGNSDNTQKTVCCRNWKCIRNLFNHGDIHEEEKVNVGTRSVNP